jgi:integrase
MPRRTLPLTATELQKAKPREKDFKLFDGGGLYLLVTPSGGKLWNMKYNRDGKEKKISIGAYPTVTLTDARQRREEIKTMLAKGIDPGAVKKALKQAGTDKATNSFEVIAREWHTKFSVNWSESHTHSTISRLEKNIFPWIGSRPIFEIEPPEMLSVLLRMEARAAAETARKMKIICGQVFRYGVATGRCKRDMTADLKGALRPPVTKNMAALTTPKEVAELLRASSEYHGTFVVKCALQLAPLWFCRPGELRKTQWVEIDFDKAELNVPIERLKLPTTTKRKNKGQLHLIPLSRQALSILKELYPLTGHSKYVFPGYRTLLRPMSEGAVLAALRKMGFTKEEMSGHGFRAMARTMIRQELHLDAEYIELQLAHATKSQNGTAYDRVSFLPERRAMMQQWADYLDGLKAVAKVIPIRQAG